MQCVRVPLLPLIAITALLAGCGQNNSVSAGQATQVSPLAEYLGGNWDDLSELQRQLQDQENRRAELVAQCMHEAGFEYTPVAGEIILGGAGAQGEFRPDDPEWVTQYGYGIVASPNGSMVLTSGPVNDPNQERIAAMSDAERSAWNEALSGELAGFVGAVPEDVPWQNRGCGGYAENQVRGLVPAQLIQTDQFAPLLEALHAMRADVATSYEMMEANRAWSNCMANAGFADFAQQSDARQSILKDYDSRITGSARAELQEREIELALTDLRCRESTNFNTQRDAATLAAETQFVEDHRADLEAFRAAAEQQG